jgi:hypothetical protein
LHNNGADSSRGLYSNHRRQLLTFVFALPYLHDKKRDGPKKIGPIDTGASCPEFAENSLW